MTEHDPEDIPLRTRTIAHLHLDDGETTIAIEHVYAPDGAFACDDCGKAGHDPGMVGLLMSDEEGLVDGLLTAEQALMLANRLTRAASLILESGEDVPDVEREAARFTPAAE